MLKFILIVMYYRCWRTSSIPEDKEKHPSSGYPEIDGKQALVEMEFEYFFEQKQKVCVCVCQLSTNVQLITLSC